MAARSLSHLSAAPWDADEQGADWAAAVSLLLLDWLLARVIARNCAGLEDAERGAVVDERHQQK